MTAENQSWWDSLADVLSGTATVGTDAGESAGEFFGSLTGEFAAPAATAVGAVDFLSDPPGWILNQFETFSAWLAGSVLPSLVEATKPDLSAEWFLTAYAVTFGLAFFVMAILSILNLVRLASGDVASRDVVDALSVQGVWFFLGSMAGPPVGYMIAQVIGAISDVLLAWAVQDSVDGVVERLREFSDTEAVLPEAGGWLLAMVVLLFLITGLVLVVVAHLIALVTLYFVGVLFPLTQVWRMDPKRRSLADSAVLVWICILASHALIYLLLGVAFHWVSDAGFAFLQDPALNSVAQALAAAFAMILAGVSPVLLFKFAKVLPSTAGQAGPSFSGSGGGSGGQATQSLSAHAQQQGNASSGGEGGKSGGEDSAPADQQGGGGDASGQPVGGGGSGADEQPGQLEQHAKEHQSRSAETGSGGAGRGTGAGQPSPGGTPAGTAGEEGAAAGATSGGGAAAGGSAGEAATVAEGAAAGSRLGLVGAAVGAGVGLAAAGGKKVVDTSQRAGDTAVEDMGHEEGS